MFLTLPRVSFRFLGLLTLIAILGFPGCRKTDLIKPWEDDPQSHIYQSSMKFGTYVLTLGEKQIYPEEVLDTRIYPEVRTRGLHLDITEKIWEIDLEVINTSPYTLYGPWIVFTDTGGQEIVNKDGFIWWIDEADQTPKRLPIVAFAKDKPERIFRTDESALFRIRVKWPTEFYEPKSFFNPMRFFIDFSYPGHRQQPIVEDVHIVATPYSDAFELTALVKDWHKEGSKDDSLKVWVDLSPLGGTKRQYLYKDDTRGDDVWQTIITTAHPEQPTPLTVYAVNKNGNRHENDVILDSPILKSECLPFRILRSGFRRMPDKRINEGYYFKNELELHNYRIEHNVESSVPEIDWETEEVVGMELGLRRSAGYLIEIDCISMVYYDSSKEPYLFVEFTERIPGCDTALVLTYLRFFVAVPRQDAPNVKFYHRERMSSCGSRGD